MTKTDGAGEQLELLRTQVRGRRPKPPAPLAESDPVAGVVLDVPLPHLDRQFDYAVPASMADAAVPGARVRVRFAGQEADGFVVSRQGESDHGGRLQPLRRVASAEPVLVPSVLQAARAVADHYAGTLADVLRLAVPPRHAATEARPSPAPLPPPTRPWPGPWSAYRGGEAFLNRLAEGSAPRAVWTALPGLGDDGWPRALAVAAATTLAAGRGAILVLPDHRDVERVADALTGVLGEGRHVRLTADAGPAARYAAFLAVARGNVRVVVGTRAAAFAPVADLGLVVCWDDGDDLHAEPRAPYPHTREVLAIRAEQSGAAALLGSISRSAEAQLLLEQGWARPVVADRAVVRQRAPRVVVTGDDELRDPAARAARLPSQALRVAREALADGPVLVQVPRAGYVPALACQACRAPARCAACRGPLALGGGQEVPSCRWCGRLAGDWSCPHCQGRRVRSVVVGSGRTAEELGRAFPATEVRASGGTSPVLAGVDGTPRLVVATPGAEPVAAGGYAAALLLDAWAPLARPDLRAAEEAVRRWLTAASLVRSAAAGGRVVLVGEAGLTPVQAVVRWDPAGHAERELAERAALALPPSVALAEVRGAADGVRALLDVVRLPPETVVLGPVPVDSSGPPRVTPRPVETFRPLRALREGGKSPQDAREGGDIPPTVRALVRAPRTRAGELAAALAAARAVLSAAKQVRLPRVQVDPDEIG